MGKLMEEIKELMGEIEELARGKEEKIILILLLQQLQKNIIQKKK